MNIEKKYCRALEWIHNLGRFGNKPGLERVTALLNMLGDPHRDKAFVHIAGTNGKGSTAAIMASVLHEAGYKVGLYTSPYLLSFTNRMAVNGKDIDRKELIELVGRVQPLVEEVAGDDALGQPTEFEVVTVLALLFYARQKVDLVVLETGLGGRLDATNVVDPLLSIITNISLEHTDVLGTTIKEIAGEKAGIVKQGKPLLTAAQDEEALEVFQARCREMYAPLYRVYPPHSPDCSAPLEKPAAILGEIREDGQVFSYLGFQSCIDDLFLPLRGLYQLANAATALAALELLGADGFTVGESEMRRGMAAVKWPGRLELLQEKPKLIMDGAHNPAAMEKLSQSLPRYFNYDRLILVIGMLADKDRAAMLKHILPLADSIIFTRPGLPRAADPRETALFALEHFALQQECRVIVDYAQALEQALKMATSQDAILVTGSLYTVSDVRAYYMAHYR